MEFLNPLQDYKIYSSHFAFSYIRLAEALVF